MKKNNKNNVSNDFTSEKLSSHFKLEEFLRSQTAERMGIENDPNQEEIENMKSLCVNLLEKIRLGVRKKIKHDALVIITSGYRSPKLNKAIGGSETSQHMSGQASDFYITNVSLFDTFKYIVGEDNLEFDKCI
jgi:zinc D-Ala-D-Ala carboxypeptidase